MTSPRQLSEEEWRAMSHEERARQAQLRQQLLGLMGWNAEHCLELGERSQLYGWLAAKLTQVERERLTDLDVTKLWEVADSLMSPASGQSLAAARIAP